MVKKGLAEFIGTFILVFVGTGTAVLGGGVDGVGILGISVAFGLAIVAAAYSIGTVSGAHLNPAVSIALFVNKRLNLTELIYYIIGQVLGAIAASGTLLYIVNSAGLDTSNLGQNSFGNLTAFSAFVVEVLITLIFVLVIVTVTSKKGSPQFAGLFIGLTLIVVNLVGIPLTGASANPARSLAPAIFVGGTALSQLWVFILAPIVGGILAALIGKYLLDTEEN